MSNQRNRPQALDYEELRKQRGTGQAESVETARLFADPISYYYNKLQDHRYMRDDYWTEAAKRGESELLISLLELSKDTTDTTNEDLDDLIENYSGHLDYDNYMTALNIPFLDDTDQSRKARLNEDVFDEEGNLISEGDGYDFGTFTDKEWAREIIKYTTGKWEAIDIELAKEAQSFFKKLGVWWLRQHGGVPGNLASGALKFLGDVYNIGEGLLNMMFNWTNDANVETRFLAAFDDDETTNPLGNLADFMQKWNYEFQRKYTGLVNAVEAHEQGYRLGEGNFIQSITDATNMGAGMNTRGRWFNGVTQAIGYMLPTVALAYFSGGSSLAISAETGLISTSIGGSMLAGASAARSLIFYTGIFGGMMKDTVEQAKAQGISYKDLNAGQVMWNAAVKSAVQYAVEVALGAILGFTASDTLMGMGKGAGVFAKAGAETGAELGKQAMATGWEAMKPVLSGMAKDALQEGLEEVSQDLSDMAINWAFDKLGNGTYKYSEDFDWQGLTDSFITGMLSSMVMGNMHNLIMDVQQKVAIRKGQADFSNLATYDANNKLIKLNYFQRINMREAMETINNWSETVNNPNAKFEDKVTAVASLNAALAVFGEYYASIGVERATKSDAILREMVEQDTKRHKIEALQKASNYTKELMMDFMKANNAAGIKYLTEKNREDILKGMDEKTRELANAMVTKIESAITNELNPDDPNTPIPREAAVRLQSALKSLGVDIIVGLDGDIVTKSDNVLFVNNEIVKNGDVESIVKGITRKLAIEEVSKALNDSQKKMILKQYNQFDSKGTLDDAVSALMFDKSFYTYILLASRETRKPYGATAFNMLATIDQILKQALAGKVDKGVITNKALSKLLTKVQDNMRQGLINFATQYQNIDIDRISDEIIPTDIKKVIREHKNVAFTKLVNDSIASKVRPSNDRITEYNELIDKLNDVLKPDVIKSLKEDYASIDYNKRIDATIALVFLLRYQTGVDLKLTYLPTDGSSIPIRLSVKTLNESLGVDYKEFIDGNFDPTKLAAPGKDFNTFGMYDTETRAGRLGMVRDILFRQSNQTLTVGTNGELMEVINKSDMVKTRYLGKQGDANLVRDIKDGRVKTIQDISTIKLDNRVGRLNLIIDSSMLDENKTVKRNGYYITGDNKMTIGHVNTVNTIMHELTHATQYYTQVGLTEGSMLTAGGDTNWFKVLPAKVNADLSQYVKENFPISYALFKANNNDVIQLLYFSLEGELQANANISALLFETGFTWKQVGRNQKAILVSPDGTREWSMTPDARKTRKSTTEASQKIAEKSKPTKDLEPPMEIAFKKAFENKEITNAGKEIKAEKDAKRKEVRKNTSNSEELNVSRARLEADLENLPGNVSLDDDISPQVARQIDNFYGKYPVLREWVEGSFDKTNLDTIQQAVASKSESLKLLYEELYKIVYNKKGTYEEFLKTPIYYARTANSYGDVNQGWVSSVSLSYDLNKLPLFGIGQSNYLMFGQILPSNLTTYLPLSYAEGILADQVMEKGNIITPDNSKSSQEVEKVVRQQMKQAVDQSNFREFKLSEENKLKRTKELYEAFQKVNPKISNFEFKPLSTSIGALYDPKSNKIIINSLSDRAGTSRLSHELVHSLENTKGYNELLDYTKKFLQRNNMYESMAKEVRKAYTDAKLLEGMTKAQIDKYIDQEVLAQFSESLFTDQAVIFNFVKTNRNLATKVLDWIKGLWTKLTGKLKPSEQSFKNELKRIEQLYLQALKNYDPAKPRTNLEAKFMWVGDKSQEAKKIQTNSEFDKMSNYDMAMFMKAGNFTSEQIRQRTGWTLDKSGYWKYEIADNKMELKIPFKQLQNYAINNSLMIPLGDIIKHDVLFEHYPHLKSFPIKLEYNPKGIGAYHYNYISINMAKHIDGTITNRINDTIQNTILHEIQHEIQYFEGWPNGANSEVLQDTLNKELKLKLKAESSQYRRWNAQFYMEIHKLFKQYNVEIPFSIKWVQKRLKSTKNMYSLTTLIAGQMYSNDKRLGNEMKTYLEYEQLADAVVQPAFDLFNEIAIAEREYFDKMGYKSGLQLYLNTLGEMEARHTGERWKLNEQQRQAEWKAMPEHSTKGIIWDDSKSILETIQRHRVNESTFENNEKYEQIRREISNHLDNTNSKYGKIKDQFNLNLRNIINKYDLGKFDQSDTTRYLPKNNFNSFVTDELANKLYWEDFDLGRVDSQEHYEVEARRILKPIETLRQTLITEQYNYFQTNFKNYRDIVDQPTLVKSHIKPTRPQKLTDTDTGSYSFDSKVNNDEKLNVKNPATFNGKQFWIGTVNLTDGTIESTYTYEQAQKTDFHHTMYFSQAQIEKVSNGENAIFWVSPEGKIQGEWRDKIPRNILARIQEQIEIPEKGTKVLKPGVLISSENMTPEATPEDYGKLLQKINNSEEINYNVDWKNADPINENWSQDQLDWGYKYVPILLADLLAIRAYTPLEHARIMGVRDVDFNKLSIDQSDTALYRLAGNSIVVDVLQHLFDGLYEQNILTKPVKLIEMFAGYGSQALALKYLNADFESHKIVEWSADAIIAYDNLHNDTSVDHSKNLNKNEIINFLISKNVARPDKQRPYTRDGLLRFTEAKLRRLYNAIVNSNNLVDIMSTKGSDLEIGDTKVNDYVVTYSFPCQDLSNAGLKAGIKEGTRSGLLLEVERILNELPKSQLPKVLVMENVPQIHNQANSPAFNKWIEALNKLGYTNEYTDMKASNYGIPQSRNRTFLVSVLGDTSYQFPGHIPLTTKVTDLLQPTSDIDPKYFLNEAGFRTFAGIGNKTRQATQATKMEINRDMSRTLTTSRRDQAGDSNFQSDVLRRNFDLQKLIKPSTPQELSETIRLINMLTDTGSAINFDEELNSRTFSNKFANESNLKYWIKKGVRAQADPRIQQFVVATTGKDFNKLPDVIKTKIYNGSLTLNDIKHFVATSANTNTYTHQMIAKHVYQNTELSKLKTADLKVLTDNLQQIAILKYMLNDDVVIEKMTPKDMVKLVADINELAETDKDLGIKLANAYRLVTKEAYERRKQHIPIELDLKQIAPILYNHYDGTIESVATMEKILSHQMYRQEKKLHEMRENLEKTGRGEVVDPTTVGENETQTSSTKVYKWLDNLKQTDIEYLYQNATEAYSNIDPIEMANALEKSVTDSILAKYAGLSRDELAKRRNAIMTELNKQLDVIREMSNAQLAVAYSQFMNAESEGRNMDPREIEGIVEIDMKEPPSLKNLKDLLRKRATNVIDRVGKVKGRYDLLSDVTKANIDPKTYTLSSDYQNMTREEVIQLSNALSEDMKMLRTIHKSQDSKAKRAEQIERRLKKLAAQEVKAKERIKSLKEQQKTMRDKVRRNFSEKVKNTDAVFKSNVEANAFVKQLLATQWEQTRKSKVQGLTENTDRNIHNGKLFFETNANTFLNMDVSDAEATARWFMEAAISNISRNSIEAQAFEAIRLYTLGHIYSQSAAGGMFEGFNANLRQSIYNALHNLAIGNATGLAVWNNIQGLINPLESMTNAEMVMGGVIISDVEKAKIAEAIATNNYNTLQQTISQIINRVNLEKPAKKDALRKVSAIRSMFMLSGPLTWLRLQVSKRSLRSLNKLSSKIGNLIVPSNTKSGQVKLTGKVTTEIQSYITHHFLDSGLFDTVINNISRYNPSSIKAKYKDAAGLANKDAILHQLVIKSMYNQYYNENLFKTKFMNQVHAGLMKVLTDNNIVRETAVRYFGKILAEKGYTLTSKDTNGNITFNEVNDVVMNDFASALGLAMADYMHSENVFSQIETVLANKSDTALFAFKLLLPFAKAQWNWFKAMVKYSPVGLVQSLVKFSKLEASIQKAETAWASGKNHIHPSLTEYQIRRNIGSGAIGTMGMLLGLMLAGLGYIDLEDEDYGTPKLRVGNLRIDISSIFGSTSILAGAAIVKGAQNAETDKFMASINAMLDPVLDGFFLTQIMALDKYSYDGFGSTTVSIAEQTLLSFIPNLFKYIANATYAGKPQANTLYYKAAKSIPFLNQVVPKKVNPYTGKDVDMWEIFNSAVPYFEVRTGSVTEEKSKALGVNKVQLRGNYEINGEKFKLTPVQAAELNKMYGQWNADVLTMFYSNKSSHVVKMPNGTFRTLRYNQMSEVQRQNAVHYIFNKNSEYAKIYAWIKAGNKYYASESEYIALRKLGITKGLYKGNKGYIKG